jgi:gamma-glutamyltranspeptidase/glutathione hydrolase
MFSKGKRMDCNLSPYLSSRPIAIGKRGAVATAQPQAALAGIEMLLQKGNAVDAAIAMAAALTVLEPTSNGLGSDAFALVWDGKLQGLNASGKSPETLDTDALQGYDHFPELGWLPVTVPGAVSAWMALWHRYGSLPLEKIFTPAIRYAEEGFALTPTVARAWAKDRNRFMDLPEVLRQSFYDCFFPQGFLPRPGAIFANPPQGKVLREIAETAGESFYRGNIAAKIVAFSEATGGYLNQKDLAEHAPLWVEPLSLDYRGYTVYELPPNGQGLAALIAMGILSGFELSRYPRESLESYHLQIEAMKLALADARHYIADPEHMAVTPQRFLHPDYLAQRRASIGWQALPLADPGLPQDGTVYLAAADSELMVSFIQSNFMGFGSGVVVPGTGIALQNRGACFALDSDHPNGAAPGKRPFHTIIPGFLAKDGQALGPFGVMGGPMQPQGHVQVLVNMLDYGMNPQGALDAPRWQFLENNRVLLESSVPRSIAFGLTDQGHVIEMTAETAPFGKGQIILKNNGFFLAGSEPRADGLALAW